MSRHHFVSVLALGTASLAIGCGVSSDSGDALGDEDTGAASQAWETEGVDEAHSTHVWIVDRAIEILAQRTDLPGSQPILDLLNNPACTAEWKRGINDADQLPQYNDLWTWTSHFYDPATQTNYFGLTDPTARQRAALHLNAALPLVQAWSLGQGCYELGLALHYMTDVTQPMHAVNYTWLNKPYGRHGHFEQYAQAHQGNAGTANANVNLDTGSPDSVLHAAAQDAKGRWPALDTALHGGSAWCLVQQGFSDSDEKCWEGTPALDAQLYDDLRAAQISAARYLYAVGKMLSPAAACQQASDKYGISFSTGSYNFAPESVRQWWMANNCRTSPSESPCQIASNEYGIDYGTGSYGFAPQDVRNWWAATGCNTRPYLASTCQILSNKYGTNHLVTWGFAPDDVRNWWSANGCTTKPWSLDNCQIASNEYGTDHLVTWGFAPNDVRNWWGANGCATHPQANAPAGQFQLQNVMAGSCLNVAGGSSEPGTETHQFYCNAGNAANLWTWVDAGNQRGMLKNIMAGTCLNVAGGSSAPGANAHQFYCDAGNGATLWEWVGTGASRQLRNVMAGTCLNVESGSSAPGANALQYYCNERNDANNWVVVGAPNRGLHTCAPDDLGSYSLFDIVPATGGKVMLHTSHNTLLWVDAQGGLHTSPDDEIGSHSLFEMLPDGDKVRFDSVHHTLMWVDTQGAFHTCPDTDQGTYSQFEIIPSGIDGKVRLRTAHGTLVWVEPGIF